MADVAVVLIGFDGEIVATMTMDEMQTPSFIQRPVAEPFTLEQLKTLTLGEWGIGDDDPIPPLPGDFDDPRVRLPKMTFQRYRLEGSGSGQRRYRRIE